MARNEEKLFGRLNRLFLQKQKEGELEKNPPRPKLATLTSADAIRRWLPSIREDIEQNLMQLEVTCHPERVLDGIRRRISSLEFEHHAFTIKLKEFEGQAVTTGNACYRKRPGEVDDNNIIASKVNRKSSTANNSEESVAASSASRIPLPILEGDLERQYAEDNRLPTVVWNCDVEACDLPLSSRLSDCRQSSCLSIPDRSHRSRSPTEQRVEEICVKTSCNNLTLTMNSVVGGGIGALLAAYGDIDD